MTPARRVAAAAAIVGLALVAACSWEPDDGGTTEPATTATTPDEATEPTQEPSSTEPTDEATGEPSAADPTDEATEEPSGAPSFPGSTDTQESEGSGAELVLTDVRFGEHEGYDRIVLEFAGDGAPGYRVGYYPDPPTRQGSGEAIDLDGDAALEIVGLHTMAVDMSDYYDGPDDLDPDADVIQDLFVDGSFEGRTIVYVGLDDDAHAFRTSTLEGPSRLVVDIADN